MELARLKVPRTVGPRLSVSQEYRRCAMSTRRGEAIPRTTCPYATMDAGRDTLADDLATRIASAAQTSADPGVLHAAAIVEIAWTDGGGKSLQRSISYLQTAARLSDHPAPVLADLAAAYLVRAERIQSAQDLARAVDVAQSALLLEPRNMAARFNLAVALEWMGLNGQAARAWREYVMADSTSGWAAVAKGRMRALATAAAPSEAQPSPGAPTPEIEAFVARTPQEARLLGWDRVLGGWGEAVGSGDSDREAELLQFAETLGSALERCPGGDATLADAVRAIRAQSHDRNATEALARAHQAYVAGRAAYAKGKRNSAAKSFEQVVALRPRSPSLLDWAQQAWAASQLDSTKTRHRAMAVLRRMAARTDTVRHPALMAMTHLSLGTVLYRERSFGSAIFHYGEGSRYFEKAGEHENWGASLYLVSDAQFATGTVHQAHTSIHRALLALKGNRGSVWLHNVLSVWAEEATNLGLWRTAARLQEEDIALVTHEGSATDLAEARLSGAHLLVDIGDHERATAEIRIIQELIRRMDDDARRWFEAELRLVSARAAVPTRPDRAATALDQAVEFFEEGNPLRLIRALSERAEARLALNNWQGATADLDQATTLLSRHNDSAPVSLRLALLDTRRNVFDRLVMLQVMQGHAREALESLDRGRPSFSPQTPSAPLDAPERWRMPEGNAAVAYSLVGDTLLIWTVRDTSVRLTRNTIERVALTRAIERVRWALERGVTGPALHNGLAELHQWLVRPVKEHLGGEGTRLAVMADGEIAGVPFAALYDPRSRRYLAEDYSVRFASSLRDAMRPTRPNAAPSGRILLVADPAFQPEAHPELERLPGAASEVAELHREYRNAKPPLSGPDATPFAFQAALSQSEVVHFAGHAVFDDEWPERSFLVLAPEKGRAGRLTASDLERGRKLSGVRLVVLSACETLRSPGGRSGGFAGFTASLLAAGAEGVVGSLWKVDDEQTQALMVAFHRAYHRSGDGPGALRQAQMALLYAEDPALRSPAAWAGFRYAGN